VRGEYPAQGGRPVAVELSVDGGRLTDVRLSADFFLEPATRAIEAALIGMPADADAAALALVIRAAVTGPPLMDGVDAAAVAIAARRAVGRATNWRDHTFDVIGPVVLDPLMHLALDEVLPAEVAAGRRPPLLRFWDWNSSLVVLGSFQSVCNEIDMPAAARYGINIARRISGGGAMFMELGNCITFSLVVPGSLVDGLSFAQSYAFLDDWVLGALAEIGVRAHYVPLNDIASDHGKIAGAAQRRFAGGVVLHHVTMAYDIDAAKMLEVLRIGRERLSEKGIASANKRVDPLSSQTQLSRADVVNACLAHFRQRYRTRDSGYTASELARAKELVATKFSTDEWTYRLP
jgi:lipoate-protein ligase A